MDFYDSDHYSDLNSLLVNLFSNPLLRNKGGRDQILSDTTMIHWNKKSIFPHFFSFH